jgi:excisionase family DNA binding protein
VINLNDPLLSSSELAAYLGVPVKWIYANKHLLPALRLGRELRFRASEVDAWLEDQRENQRHDLRYRTVS